MPTVNFNGSPHGIICSTQSHPRRAASYNMMDFPFLCAKKHEGLSWFEGIER
jgi:hypothetical protein